MRGSEKAPDVAKLKEALKKESLAVIFP